MHWVGLLLTILIITVFFISSSDVCVIRNAIIICFCESIWIYIAYCKAFHQEVWIFITASNISMLTPVLLLLLTPVLLLLLANTSTNDKICVDLRSKTLVMINILGRSTKTLLYITKSVEP